jgi:transposase-like protein
VPAKARRRRFTAAYKLKILEQADQAGSGDVAALLRREGLYSSHLSSWRSQRRRGTLQELGKKRGGKADPKRKDKRVDELEKENRKLKRKLADAEYLIEVQNEVASILGIPLPSDDNTESE